MTRWTPVVLMGALACATTLDPAFAEVPEETTTCPEPEPEPEPTVYDRKKQWKHWIDADKDCQSTRQEVLIRDSEVPVTYKDERQCAVATGQWTCPWTGQVITDPSKVDIDHLVALKDAHYAGGWDWTQQARQDYANNLDDPKQLRATSQYGNRSKGSKGPDEWLPPLASARCEYINDWVNVKEGYELGMDEGEYAVIIYMMHICDNGQVPPLPQN